MPRRACRRTCRRSSSISSNYIRRANRPTGISSHQYFRELHLRLDEIVDTAREASDTIAERIRGLSALPDARSDAPPGSTPRMGDRDEEAVPQ